jgi:hypothetical protein
MLSTKKTSNVVVVTGIEIPGIYTRIRKTIMRILGQ